jgi:acyl-homoserine lactone acylase PvdQ
MHRVVPIMTLGLIAAMASSGMSAEKAGKATIYRDVWGVPHIYADTAPEGAFGLGYAQAEDRLDDLFAAVRTGLGRMSEVYGADYVDQDYIMRLCRNEELCRNAWNDTPPELQAIVVAFQSGIEAYIAQHPQKVPESKLDLEPWMFGTVGRAMILRWPLGAIQDDLGKRKKLAEKPKKKAEPKTKAPSFSNEWAVAPSRSAEKCPILLCDPHVTWESIAVFYEARVHAGDLHMCGFFLMGAPVMGYGHNMNVGWANTTGGPDTADVYELKVKPGLIPQYEYDGKWRTPRLSSIRINVKGQDKPVIRPSAFTHLGPLVSPPEGEVAYAGATPYFEATRLFEQSYQMNLAKNARELYKAMGMLELMEQNMMFADTSGNIAYVRQGRAPIRPDGYDWNAPVPGHTSATAWKGVHGIDDMVQVFNPPSGYMQNCNISPAVMMKASPMTRDKYKPYLFNVFDWERTPRGDRSTDLLHSDALVTKEKALSYATDVFDIQSPLWQSVLKTSVQNHAGAKAAEPEFSAAVKAVLDWDGNYLPEYTQTVLFKAWREKAKGKAPFAPLAEGKELSADAQRLAVDLFAEALAEVKKQYGQWDVAWGEVFRVGRGDKFVGVPGADYGSRGEPFNYTETLFDVSWKPDKQHPGKFVAYKGSEALILMFFHKDGVESYTSFAWGQSGDPKSPHYMDQGEKLFAKRKMKPTFWKKEDLLKNLESQKTVDVAIPDRLTSLLSKRPTGKP